MRRQILQISAFLPCFFSFVFAQVTDVDFSNNDEIVVYEHNHYAFRSESNGTIYLSTVAGSDYNGTEVFNNGAVGPREYLLFSPDENSSRNWKLYDKNDPSNVRSITVSDYINEDLRYSDNIQKGDQFGYSIKINEWNQTIVGSPGAGENLGSVHVFDSNNSIIPIQEIIPVISPGESNRTMFGASIDAGSDILVVGAPDYSEFTGKVFLYQNDSGNYNYVYDIVDNNGSEDLQFGYALSILSNGSQLAISSPNLKNNEEESGVGKVSIFSINELNASKEIEFWSSSDRNTSGDSFGQDIALNEDFLVVGAPTAKVGDNAQGLVYIFKKDDDGNWENDPDVINAEFLSDGDHFGYRVDITDNIVFVGAKYGDDETRTDNGAVYIFEYVGNEWQEKTKLAPPNEFDGQVFSNDISASEDFLAVSSTGIGSGVISYIYKMENSAEDWRLVSILESNETNVSEPSYVALDFAPGFVAQGLYQDSSGVDQGGSMKKFSNLGWQNTRAQKFPPFLEKDVPYSFSIAEDQSGGFLYDFNATHPFDLNIKWEIIDFNLTEGNFSLGTDSGIFFFKPVEHFNGLLELEIKLKLEEGETTEVFEIQVTPEPDAPFFEDQDENLPYAMVGDEYSFEINATDVDGDNLNFSLIPSDLGLFFDGNELRGNPSGSSVGNVNSKTYDLVIQVSDGELTAQKTFSLQIYKQNRPPRFEDENGTTISKIEIQLQEDFSQEEWISIIPDIFPVDDDPSNSGFSLSIASDPLFGNVFLDVNRTDNGMIIYDSEQDYSGDDNFTIRLTDSNIPSKHFEIDFEVSLVPVNDPPQIISSPQSLVAKEGEEYSYELLVNDPDVNDTFSLQITEYPSWLSFDAGQGRVFGVPEWDDYSEDKQFVTIVAKDALGLQDIQQFELSVEPLVYPPVITQGSFQVVSIDEDETSVPWQLLELNAEYPNPDTSTSQLSWRFVSSPSNGVAVLSGGEGKVFVDYTPDGNFTGSDTFSLEVYDNKDDRFKDQIEVYVMISSVPDDPTFLPSIRFTDAVIGYHWSYSFEAVDGDNQMLSVSKSDDSPDWLNLSMIEENGRYFCKLEGTPKQKDVGIHEVVLFITDEIGSIRDQSFQIRVISRNYLPTISANSIDDLVTFTEDTELLLVEPLKVIDEDNQRITWGIYQSPPNGIATIDYNDEGILNYIRITPEGNFTGYDSIILEVSDGIARDTYLIELFVQNENDPPIFTVEDKSFLIKEGSSFNFDITFNDGDGIETTGISISGAPDWVKIEKENYLDGIFSISGKPDESHEGNATLEFLLIDETAEEDKLTIDLSVYVLNHSPVISPTSIELQMTEDLPSTWSSDVLIQSIVVEDEETGTNDLIWSVSENPQNGTARIDLDGRNLVYVPDGNFSGIDRLTLEISDRPVNNDLSKSVYLDVNITVSGVNDAPVFRSNPMDSSLSLKQIVWSDYFETRYDIKIFDADGVGEGTHEISVLSELPTWIKFEDFGNGTGAISGKPGLENEGVYKIHLRAQDMNGASADQVFNLHVVVDDYPPIFESKQSGIAIETIKLHLNEDGEISEWDKTSNFVAVNPDHETDDPDEIMWSIYEPSSKGGFIQVSGEGGIPSFFYYKPAPNFNGIDNFILKMDEGDRFSLLNVEVNIYPIADNPKFTTNLDEIIYVESGVPFSLVINALDPDGDDLQFKLISPFWDLNNWLNIVDEDKNGTLTLAGTPQVSIHGNNYNYNLVVIDETGRLENKAFSIFVKGSNNEPTIGRGNEVTIAFSADGTPRDFNLNELTAFDPEGDLLSWSIPSGKEPLNGLVELEGVGQFPQKLNYFPRNIYTNEDSFTLRVSDSRKFDEIKVNAVVIWDDDEPYISQLDKISLYEGQSILEEITISSTNFMEEFAYSLSSAPSWLHLLSIERGRVLLGGEVPVGSSGTYEIKFNIEGIRSGLTSMSFEIEVLSLDYTHIELFGNQVEMISAAQVYKESGFTGTDLKSMEDISAMVRVSSDGKNSYGINKFHYSFDEGIVGANYQTRLVREYENCPLKVNNVSFLEGFSLRAIQWSQSEYFYTWGDIESISTNELDSNLTFMNEQSSLVRLQKDIHTVEKLGSIVSEGNASFDVVKDYGELGTLVSGTFSGDVEVLGRKILSENNQNIFICLLDEAKNLVWTKTFGGEVDFSDLNLFISPEKKILLFGSYLGDFEIKTLGRSFSTDKKGNFYLSISKNGDFIECLEINLENGSNLQGIECSEDAIYLISREFDESNTTNALGIIKYDYQFNYINDVKLKSDESLSISDFAFKNEKLWICGESRGVFSFQDEAVHEGLLKDGFLISLDEDLEISLARFLETNSSSSIREIEFDYWGNLILGIEFRGYIEGLGESIPSSIGQDIILSKLNPNSGQFIWSKEIISHGNQELVNLSSNSVGAVVLGIFTDQDFDMDGHNIRSSQTKNLLNVINFESDLGIPTLQFESIELTGEESYLQRIDAVYGKDLFFKLINAPDWVSVLGGKDGNTTVSLLINPKFGNHSTLFGDGYDIKIRAFNIEGDFCDETVNLKYADTEKNSYLLGKFPEFDLDFHDILSGEGRVNSLFSIGENNWVMAINKTGDLILNQNYLVTIKDTLSSVIFYNTETSFYSHVDFLSSEQVTFVDCFWDVNTSNLFILGNFSGTLSVADKEYYSNGGQDIFLFEMNSEGIIQSGNVYGSVNDDFAKALAVGDDFLYIGSEFYDHTRFSSKTVVSEGSTKSFVIAKILKNDFGNVQWLKSLDGTKSYYLSDIELTDSNNKIIIAGSSSEKGSGNKTNILSFNIFDIDGNLLDDVSFSSTSRVNNPKILFVPETNSYVLACEFEGQISVGKHKVTSNGGFDILLVGLRNNFDPYAAKNFGSKLNDRLGVLDKDPEGQILFSGSFFNTIKIDDNVLFSDGSSDGFLAKLEAENFRVMDHFQKSGPGFDSIDCLEIISAQDIHIAGTASMWEETLLTQKVRKNLFWNRLGASNSKPMILDSVPHVLPTSRDFDFTLNTGPWIGEVPQFYIEEVDEENVYNWIEISVDTKGEINFVGTSPKSESIYPFSFVLCSSNQQKLNVDFSLNFIDSIKEVPIITMPESVEIFQHELSTFDFYVSGIGIDSSSIKIKGPEWIILEENSAGKKFTVSLYPQDGNLGVHELTLMAYSSTGNYISKKVKIKVFPRIFSEDQKQGNEDTEDLTEKMWNESWFGIQAIFPTAWTYHLELGWIFIKPTPQSNDVWFWLDGWGWLWTKEGLFNSELGSYLYSAEDRDWIYFKDSMFYKYKSKEWVGN